MIFFINFSRKKLLKCKNYVLLKLSAQMLRNIVFNIFVYYNIYNLRRNFINVVSEYNKSLWTPQSALPRTWPNVAPVLC